MKAGVICSIKSYPLHPDWTDRFVTVVEPPASREVESSGTGRLEVGIYAIVGAEWMPIDVSDFTRTWAIEPKYLRPINDPGLDVTEQEEKEKETT
jgi:hypothetical protein